MAQGRRVEWPRLREELAVFQGPNAADGAPTWSLRDPVRNLFFRLDWETFEILTRWHLANPQAIAQALAQETTLRTDAQAVAHVADFLVQNELVQRLSPASVAALGAMHQRRQTGWLTWLLHHYLFFRVPLWRPDAWLNRALPAVQWVFGHRFRWLTALALVLGLYEVEQQWERFTTTLVDWFSWRGLLAYAVTMVCVKFLHELGHAFTAKRFGCKVPVMGVAFLVLFPVAYTDVNDAWKLSDKRQRMAIDAAGILTELVVAVWSTLLWSFLPEGAIRQGFFLLATTTWISTVLVNTSPFMRFDGYFLLMDALDMPNLHQRAFALARWRLREALFATGAPVPEVFAPLRQRFLLAFAYVTWVYRLVVFSGIAYLVYASAPWPLGLVLGAVEVIWFLVLPVWRECLVWFEMREDILRSARSRRLWGATAFVLMLVFLPWDPRIGAPGLLRPQTGHLVAAPGAAMLGAIDVAHGARAQAGDVLVHLIYPDLSYQQQVADARLSGMQYKAENAGLDARLHDNMLVLDAGRDQARAEVEGVARERSRYDMSTPIPGVVYWTDPDWQPGMWVRANAPLVEVADPGSWQVYAYLSEKEVRRISVGDGGRFFADSGRFGAVSLRVSRVDEDATHVLADGMLASVHGGEILVREKAGQLTPEQAIYRVTLTATGDVSDLKAAALSRAGMPVLRGHVVVYGDTQAWAAPYWRAAFAVVLREWSL